MAIHRFTQAADLDKTNGPRRARMKIIHRLDAKYYEVSLYDAADGDMWMYDHKNSKVYKTLMGAHRAIEKHLAS